MKHPNLDFLEPHEREEVLRILANKPDRLKWVRERLTTGPLEFFWPAAVWVLGANVLGLPAFWLWGDSRWLCDDLATLCCVLFAVFVTCGFAWLIEDGMEKEAKKNRQRKEEQKLKDDASYCRFHKTYH